jgi:hypothetical protein
VTAKSLFKVEEAKKGTPHSSSQRATARKCSGGRDPARTPRC